MLDDVRWRGLVLTVALWLGVGLGGALVAFSARAQVDPAERAASAAEAALIVQEQGRDWIVVGLLGAAVLGGFGMAYRVI